MCTLSWRHVKNKGISFYISVDIFKMNAGHGKTLHAANWKINAAAPPSRRDCDAVVCVHTFTSALTIIRGEFVFGLVCVLRWCVETFLTKFLCLLKIWSYISQVNHQGDLNYSNVINIYAQATTGKTFRCKFSDVMANKIKFHITPHCLPIRSSHQNISLSNTIPELGFFGFSDKCKMCQRLVGANYYIYKWRTTEIVLQILAIFVHFCENSKYLW